MFPCLPLYQMRQNAWKAGKEAHLGGVPNSDFVDSGLDSGPYSPRMQLEMIYKCPILHQPPFLSLRYIKEWIERATYL
jgi:hypothetical protein